MEKEIFGQVANLLNLEVDLLFFDTTSTYFEPEEADEPVPGTSTATPTDDGGDAEGGRPRGSAPTASPRTTATTCPRSSSAWPSPVTGSRCGCGAGPGTRRLGADPAGEGRHAGLVPVAGRAGSPTAASPPRRTAATCARAGTTTSSASGSAPAPPRPAPPCPGRAATRKSPATCGSRKSASPRTSGSSSAITPREPTATPPSAPG